MSGTVGQKNDMVALNYKWFDAHREEIIQGHHNEYALIQGQKVIGYFGSIQAGIEYAQKNNIELGTFALQQCITAKEETAFYANWRVSFAQ